MFLLMLTSTEHGKTRFCFFVEFCCWRNKAHCCYRGQRAKVLCSYMESIALQQNLQKK